MADLSHIKLMEVGKQIGPYRMDEVILFNINRVSMDEAIRLVREGEYNDNVLVIPKRQWNSLFLDGKE